MQNFDTFYSAKCTSKCSWLSRGSIGGGMPSGPGGTVSAGLMYMFCIRMVGLMVGRLCNREQRSPCRHALPQQAQTSISDALLHKPKRSPCKQFTGRKTQQKGLRTRS